MIHDQEKGGTDENACKKTHARIVTRPAAHFKRSARQVALGNNGVHFRHEWQPLC